MKLLLVILSVLFFSCQDKEVFLDIPDYVRPHYDQFFIEAEKRGVHIEEETLFFKETDGFPNSQATARADTRDNTITIKIVSFNRLSLKRKEHLIFHEMGHYLLRRHHNNDKKDGKPVSMMYPRAFSYKDEMRDYYLDELFKTP